jgi:hypothetical protein
MLCRNPRRVERVKGRSSHIFFGAMVVAMLSLVTVGNAASSSLPRPEKRPAAKAMASVFAHPSTGRVPASVVAAVTRLAKTATVGRVRVSKGRLLLSDLGPKHHSIYVFPTTKGEVCFDITHLAEGCKKAFLVGEPASMDGGNLFFPSTSGPPAELAGLTKDGVRRVQVVIHGTPHKAVFGHDAWYYRFPNSRIPATAATKLIVTLKNGSTKTVPTRIVKPKLP